MEEPRGQQCNGPVPSAARRPVPTAAAALAVAATLALLLVLVLEHSGGARAIAGRRSAELGSGRAAPLAGRELTRIAGIAQFDGLLSRRSAALLRHDRNAWLATSGSHAPSATPPSATPPSAPGTAATLFDRLAVLPLAGWRYRATDSPAAAPAAVRARYGPDAVLLPVSVTYRLSTDTADLTRSRQLTLARVGGVWSVVADVPTGTGRDPWDLGPVTVVRGTRSLVIGAGAAHADVAALARLEDQAAARVDEVWGSGWPRTVVVELPATVSQLAQLLGRSNAAGLDQVAAVTSGPLARPDRVSGPPAGTADRIMVNPTAYDQLTGLGRQVVLTHETTHVATRSGSAIDPPLWLEEGFADYVAYWHTGLSRAFIGADALRSARAGRTPAHLPGAAEFDPARQDIAPAYADAWLACRLIADRGGTAGLLSFYREAAGLGAGERGWTSAQAMATAYRQVLGTDQGGFERQWRSYVSSVATGG